MSTRKLQSGMLLMMALCSFFVTVVIRLHYELRPPLFDGVDAILIFEDNIVTID